MSTRSTINFGSIATNWGDEDNTENDLIFTKAGEWQ